MKSLPETDGDTALRILVIHPRRREGMQIRRVLARDLKAEVHLALAEPSASVSKTFDAVVVDSLVQRRASARIAGLPTVVVADDGGARDCIELARLGVQTAVPLRCAMCTREKALATSVLWAIERARLLQTIERAHQRERRAALRDPLTGLANLRLFQDRFRRLIAQGKRTGKRFALLILDLDRFKGVNDRLGHAAGDGLLREVADALNECVRETDTVARIGGDEFAVLLDGVGGRADATLLARRILRRIARPVVTSGEIVIPSISIGIALFSDDGASCSALQRSADSAMYAAKREGGRSFRHARAARVREVPSLLSFD